MGIIHNTIENNDVSKNDYGIFIESPSNTIKDNSVNSNWFGIRIMSYENTVVNNTISYNVTGINLRFSYTNNILNNDVYKNDNGIYLEDSSHNNIVSGNTVKENNDSGIWLSESSQDMITDNTVESNGDWGIHISHSNNNTIKSNIIKSNGICGVQVYYSNGNTMYNNRFLYNACNACDTNYNYWNIEKQPGTNIIGGSYLGGNSWSDYTGRDLDNDGLGNTLLPHISSGGILNGGDQHPLVKAGVNNPPYIPYHPWPGNRGIYQDLNVDLNWNGGDPDPGDTVTYDVYFGDSSHPPLVSSNQSEASYDPGILQDSTTYYWNVVTKDSLSFSSEGPEWNFTIDTNIALLLPFEDDGGTTIDTSGNDNDGTVNGAVFLPGGGILNSNAYQFDWSSHNNIQVPYQESQTATEALTLEAWIYPTAWDNIYAHYNRIVSKQPVYLLRGTANGHAHFQILTENYGYRGVYDSQVMSLNEWHYVVGTFNGLSLKLYVDGILRDSLELAEEDTVSTNERDIFVGESPVLAEGFTGTIDNVAIYKRARSQSEVEETYASIMLRCEGDFDDDGDVDGSDLAVFSADFGRTDCDDDCSGDFDSDGDVDGSDLSTFAADFGRTDCPYCPEAQASTSGSKRID